jgi:hypothetical protein
VPLGPTATTGPDVAVIKVDKPSVLPFFTHFEVNLEQHKLKPYMAQVNHNVLNETTWINIVHTFMEILGHGGDSKTNTMPIDINLA